MTSYPRITLNPIFSSNLEYHLNLKANHRFALVNKLGKNLRNDSSVSISQNHGLWIKQSNSEIKRFIIIINYTKSESHCHLISMQTNIKANPIIRTRYTLHHSKFVQLFVWHMHCSLFVGYMGTKANIWKQNKTHLVQIKGDWDSFQCKTEGGFMYSISDSSHCSQKCYPPNPREKRFF